MSTRVSRIRSRMRDQHLQALMITKPENIYYLSGFSGSSGALVITEDQQYLVSDFRYVSQAAAESPDWTFFLVRSSIVEAIRDLLCELGVRTVGFEPEHLTVALFHQLANSDSPLPYQLLPTEQIVESLRMIKEPEEIERIREAVRITDDTLAHVQTIMTPGVTERELAMEAEWQMRQRGADGAAFSIIVASGAHSALPHAQPGERKLAPGDLVVIDMGARYQHYCADMTRTFAIGHASDTAREIYQVCLEAQLAGVADITAGMSGCEADRIVRDVIEAAGYGEYFGHGTGHGVGLEIHEAPRLSRIAEQPLPVGAAVTIEPGIYLPDIGGVRIEDLALVTDTGMHVLTGAPKPTALPIIG